MSAKKLADFIFENTGRAVNAAMRKLGLSKSEIEGLSANQLKMRIAEKHKGSYKGRTRARNSDTGKLVVGGGALATLASIWDEIDPTKVKKMGDGTLRADERKKIGKAKSETTTNTKKKTIKKTPPKAPPSRPKSITNKTQQYMKDKSGKATNVKFNSRGGMLKKGKK
tara:strand:+ start:76 stop:579 length:504 start_codon:yes stop_codon:yes gene_type:complete